MRLCASREKCDFVRVKHVDKREGVCARGQTDVPTEVKRLSRVKTAF